MTRKRIIKHYDNGWVIRLLQTDANDLGLKDGDLIDIEDCVIISDNLNKIKKEKSKLKKGEVK